MKKLLLIIAGLVALVCLNGCTAIIAAQLKGKLPVTAAEELTVAVNVVGAGGGTIAVTGVQKKPDGSVVAATFDEQINTGAGSLTIKGKNVEIPGPKN